MKYKALALDLDGTLTNREKKVPAGNKEAIAKAIDAGVKVILASGRPLFGITPIARELELDKKGGYILAYNGGCIVDCKTGKQMSATIMPQDCIADICSLARANGVYALTYADTQIAAESDSDEYVKKEAICNSTTIKKVDDLRKFVDYPVEKFLVVGEHEKLLPVQKALLDKHEGVINAFFSESYFLEVVPAGVAKDASLDKLLTMLDITSEELVAWRLDKNKRAPACGKADEEYLHPGRGEMLVRTVSSLQCSSMWYTERNNSEFIYKGEY